MACVKDSNAAHARTHARMHAHTRTHTHAHARAHTQRTRLAAHESLQLCSPSCHAAAFCCHRSTAEGGTAPFRILDSDGAHTNACSTANRNATHAASRMPPASPPPPYPSSSRQTISPPPPSSWRWFFWASASSAFTHPPRHPPICRGCVGGEEKVHSAWDPSPPPRPDSGCS